MKDKPTIRIDGLSIDNMCEALRLMTILTDENRSDRDRHQAGLNIMERPHFRSSLVTLYNRFKEAANRRMDQAVESAIEKQEDADEN